jgi:hypothetical protein
MPMAFLQEFCAENAVSKKGKRELEFCAKFWFGGQFTSIVLRISCPIAERETEG